MMMGLAGIDIRSAFFACGSHAVRRGRRGAVRERSVILRLIFITSNLETKARNIRMVISTALLPCILYSLSCCVSKGGGGTDGKPNW
ncbi:hypothetical protein AV654_25110 [Paenibacillus elgii]|uniref:Uncharacterized protein n=1 Tax=Paenibacillus elgii TaxID=189691 RepID=A0A161S890_9BACL|nr:hypothetical protein AV654_25110 [Paenibacillus elgii]